MQGILIWILIGLGSAEVIRQSYSDLDEVRFIPFYLFFGGCGVLSLLGLLLYLIYNRL